MKHNINLIKSVWRRWRKPGRATLDAIRLQNAPSVRDLDSAVWQHIAELEGDRRDLLTIAKAVVHSRDVSVDRRPSSVSMKLLREMIAKTEG